MANLCHQSWVMNSKTAMLIVVVAVTMTVPSADFNTGCRTQASGTAVVDGPSAVERAAGEAGAAAFALVGEAPPPHHLPLGP